MARADAEALKPLLPLLRQLREIAGVQEVRPGTFQARREGFIQFHAESGVLHAELRKAGGAGVDRYPLATPAEQRRLVDDARLRAKRLDDE